jgi:ADP-heptose:LPS heptosyltransferase/glycosyltransferase involved in cell wall biosynthesis
MNTSPLRNVSGSIAVFRALQLGDLLCAVPAWRALRAANPRAHIALIGLPWAQAFVDRFPSYFDEFIAFPGYPGLPEQTPDLNQLQSFLTALSQRRFDWLLQMHGSGSYVNDVMRLCRARHLAGFYDPSGDCPHRCWFMPYPDHGSEIHRHIRLMQFLGVSSCGDELEFPLTESDRTALAGLNAVASLTPGSYICLHPGGRSADRRWPVGAFASVARALSSRGFRIVVTGTAEETDLGDELVRTLPVPLVNVIGKTSLGMLGLLIGRARLLVSNDTGVSHIAAALRIPSVILCVGSDPDRWGPLNRDRHRLLIGSTTTVRQVLDEAEDLLAEPPSTMRDSTAPPTMEASPDLRVSPTRAPHPLRILTWHVHGNYLYYLAHTPHEWFLPVGRAGPGYAGCAPGFPWPSYMHEVPVEQLRHQHFDCILFQSRSAYCEDQAALLSEAQRKLPRLYLEHDPPQDDPTDSKHMVDDPDMLLVHVTHFNRMMWDSGRTQTCVIEHGIPSHHDLGYTGDLARGLVVVNDMPRRGRRVGADLFHRARSVIPLDLIGMNSEAAGGLGEISHAELPAFMTRYRFFFNPIRYTSLGLAVCEAMHLGMPVVGLATTEMATVIVNDISGYIDTDTDRLIQRMAYLLASPEEARRLGNGARQTAQSRFGLDRFVKDWDRTLREFTSRHTSRRRVGERIARRATIGDMPCLAESH